MQPPNLRQRHELLCILVMGGILFAAGRALAYSQTMQLLPTAGAAFANIEHFDEPKANEPVLSNIRSTFRPVIVVFHTSQARCSGEYCDTFFLEPNEWKPFFYVRAKRRISFESFGAQKGGSTGIFLEVSCGEMIISIPNFAKPISGELNGKIVPLGELSRDPCQKK